jgi:phosphoglycolate phosphatase
VTDVLFDLDGTLTDPGLGITRCLQHALGRLGHAVPPSDDLRRCVGPPLRDSLARLMGTADEAALAEAIRLYRERFLSEGMLENEVYADVPAGLTALRRAGHRLWVATSKPHVYARQILEHFQLAPCFAGVYGAELSGENSDKGALIRVLLARERLSPPSTCMVGDRAWDIRGARENGIRAVGVRWGYGTEEELRAAGPDRTVGSMAELCAYLS